MAIRYQIFVSSTHLDLKAERESIINELNKAGFIAVGMEQFPATDEEQMEYIRPIIDESDYYIVIVKGRYGSADSNGDSYTEREFRYAVESGKPALAFIYGDRKSLNISDTDDDPEKMRKLKEFISELESRRIVKYWKAVDELVASVKDSINAIVRRKPGTGWVRGDQAIDPNVYKELEQLRKENVSLKERVGDNKMKLSFPENIAHGADLFNIQYRYTKAENKVLESRKIETIFTHSDVFSYQITWDQIIDLITEYLYTEEEEGAISRLILSYIYGKCDKKAEFSNYSIQLLGEPVRQIRYQLERLGIITTFLRSVTEYAFDKPRNASYLCWSLTAKGRAYISELRAIRRTEVAQELPGENALPS
jgi:hypothetical protein